MGCGRNGLCSFTPLLGGVFRQLECEGWKQWVLDFRQGADAAWEVESFASFLVAATLGVGFILATDTETGL